MWRGATTKEGIGTRTGHQGFAYRSINILSIAIFHRLHTNHHPFTLADSFEVHFFIQYKNIKGIVNTNLDVAVTDKEICYNNIYTHSYSLFFSSKTTRIR